MPTTAEHLSKAVQNEKFAMALDRTTSVGAEWAIVVLFYVAVHYIQAYFAKIGSRYTQHTARDSAIKRDRRLADIYVDYRELETFSRDARYDTPMFSDQHFQQLLPKLQNVKACIRPLL